MSLCTDMQASVNGCAVCVHICMSMCVCEWMSGCVCVRSRAWDRDERHRQGLVHHIHQHQSHP